MSADTNNPKNTPDPEIEENVSNAPSKKDKFIRFVEKNKKLIIGISVAVTVLIISLIIYFNFANKSMKTLANEFCTCADAKGSDFYAYSKDGFGYQNDLVGCFAEDFRVYGRRYNKATKKALLIDFQKEVIKKCPEKLVDIFEYK
jgi:hypothetical protein